MWKAVRGFKSSDDVDEEEPKKDIREVRDEAFGECFETDVLRECVSLCNLPIIPLNKK